jgi:ComF family protein
MELLYTLARILFPDFCSECGAYGIPLCADCIRTLPTPLNCPVYEAVTALPYQNPSVKKAILTLKQRTSPELIQLLAERMYESSRELLIEYSMTRNFTNPIIIPIPTSRQKLRTVGFNHAELLAKAFASQVQADFPTEFATHIVAKKHTTTKQSRTESRADRFANIQNVFTLQQNIDIYNRCIIIVDDVITTGATMSVVRQLLLDAGARHVVCIALAH